MKGAGALAITLALTACAVPDAGPNPSSATEVVASTTEGREDVVQVGVRASATSDKVVCRKTAPTGSRIAAERCETTAGNAAADEIARDQMLRDIDEIRMQAAQRELARQDAAAAMARPPGR